MSEGVAASTRGNAPLASGSAQQNNRRIQGALERFRESVERNLEGRFPGPSQVLQGGTYIVPTQPDDLGRQTIAVDNAASDELARNLGVVSAGQYVIRDRVYANQSQASDLSAKGNSLRAGAASGNDENVTRLKNKNKKLKQQLEEVSTELERRTASSTNNALQARQQQSSVSQAQRNDVAEIKSQLSRLAQQLAAEKDENASDSGATVKGQRAPGATSESVKPIEVKVERKHEKCLKKLCKNNHHLLKENTALKAQNEQLKWVAGGLQHEVDEAKLKIDDLQADNERLEKLNSNYYVQVEALRARVRALEELQLELTSQEGNGEREIIVQEKIVEVPVEKPIEIIKHIIVEKIVEKPIEIVRTVEVPQNEKLMPFQTERIVEVPVEKIVEKIVEVPKIVEKIVEVPKIEIVEKEVPVYIDKPVYIETAGAPQPPQVVVDTFAVEQLRKEVELLRRQAGDAQREGEEWHARYVAVDQELSRIVREDLHDLQSQKAQLLTEVRDNHAVIDDLRTRIEQLYDQINRLTGVNQQKNDELLAHINFLEGQLRARYAGPLPAIAPPSPPLQRTTLPSGIVVVPPPSQGVQVVPLQGGGPSLSSLTGLRTLPQQSNLSPPYLDTQTWGQAYAAPPTFSQAVRRQTADFGATPGTQI